MKIINTIAVCIALCTIATVQAKYIIDFFNYDSMPYRVKVVTLSSIAKDSDWIEVKNAKKQLIPAIDMATGEEITDEFIVPGRESWKTRMEGDLFDKVKIERLDTKGNTIGHATYNIPWDKAGKHWALVIGKQKEGATLNVCGYSKTPGPQKAWAIAAVAVGTGIVGAIPGVNFVAAGTIAGAAGAALTAAGVAGTLLSSSMSVAPDAFEVSTKSSKDKCIPIEMSKTYGKKIKVMSSQPKESDKKVMPPQPKESETK